MTRLLLTSGRGPAECRIALSAIVRRLIDEATVAGVDADAVFGKAADEHGPGSAIVSLHGDGAAAFATGWTGTVQWIAPSPVRPHHKRKNWFIGIINLGPVRGVPRLLAPSDVRFQTFAAGGPGGQHQNKTESAVRATHTSSGLSVVARNERSQHRNKAIALERLVSLLALGAEIDAIAEKHAAKAAHDDLERGHAVRRFKGPEFKPL